MVKLSFSDMAAATECDAHFIDIDVTSSEFEFQMPSSSSSVSVENDSTTSPADELFFKGKLLPLHLPPRLQMFQTLLNINTLEVEETATYEDGRNPAESSSPSESCRVSCELNPSEFFFQWSTSSSNEFGSFVHNNPKKSWSKKLKLMKQSSVLLTQKLKNSRAYLINLKALFLKSASSNGENREAAAIEKQECGKSNRMIITKKIPFGAFSNVEETKSNDNNNNIIQQPRRSFSGAIKQRHSPSKCLSSSSSTSNSSCSGASSLSSSFSVNSNALFNLHFFNKSSGEIETSVEDAIAHCKNCQ